VAKMLNEIGISAEVLDLRSLRPMDSELIQSSFSKTKSLLVVEEGPITGGWAGEVIAIANEVNTGAGKKLWRIATDDRPIPFSPILENAFFASAKVIFDSVRERHGK
jgi:pyruvate/2-oxoglutarate/acetoin dehydrogenase E1 component